MRDSGKYSHIEIRISEGRNRQIRRMVEAIGGKVMKLVRTGIGPVQIGALRIGTWRALEGREVEALSGSPTRSGTSGRDEVPALRENEHARGTGERSTGFKRAGGCMKNSRRQAITF